MRKNKIHWMIGSVIVVIMAMVGENKVLETQTIKDKNLHTSKSEYLDNSRIEVEKTKEALSNGLRETESCTIEIATLEQALEGTWMNEQGRVIHFTEGILEDSYLGQLFELQTYQITAPNEILIEQKDKDYIERITMNVSVELDEMYLFVCDQYGNPNKDSMEKFLRQ